MTKVLYTAQAHTTGGRELIPDHSSAAELIREAEHVCPYSNAFRGNIDITYTLDGQPV